MPELSQIGLLTAFAAGVISFLSPCVPPLVPGYVSYIAGGAGRSATGDGRADLAARLPALGLSFCFVLGFSSVFVILGASATALGQLLLSYRYETNLIGGAIVAVFGLFMVGALRPAWMMRESRIHVQMPGGRPTAAYVLGLAFAFGWTPCIGPILGAILTVSAASATVGNGIVLLSVYSLGLGLPFLFAALFTDWLISGIKEFGRVGRALHAAAGAMMIAMGLAMMTGMMSTFSFWLLERFPVLATIG